MSTVGLGRRAARGAAVSLAGQVIKGLIQLVGVIILARMLNPRDYGLLAMVTVVVGVGEIFRDFGLSTAAVRAPVLTRATRDNLFWINTGIGVVLALATAAIGPLMSQIMHEPALVTICQVLGVTFLFNGAATQYRASLERDLQFRAAATADAISPAVALVAGVGAALAGWGYWALVAQAITLSLSMLVILVWKARWLPGYYTRGEKMGDLLRFGGNMVGTQLIGYLSNNVDTFTIGLRFGTVSMGLYNRGFQLLMQPYNQVRVPVTKVAIPVLAKLHDEPQRYSRYLIRGQLSLGYTLCLALALVSGIAQPLTLLLLGPKWIGVGVIVSLFAIAAVFQTLSLVGYWVYVTKNLTAHLFQYTIFSAVVRITCVLVGSHWGVIGVASGYALGPVILWPISFWWLSRRANLPLTHLYGGAGRITLVCTWVAVSAWAAQRITGVDGALTGVLVGVGGAVVATSLLVVLVPALRRDLSDVLLTIKSVKK